MAGDCVCGAPWVDGHCGNTPEMYSNPTASIPVFNYTLHTNAAPSVPLTQTGQKMPLTFTESNKDLLGIPFDKISKLLDLIDGLDIDKIKKILDIVDVKDGKLVLTVEVKAGDNKNNDGNTES